MIVGIGWREEHTATGKARAVLRLRGIRSPEKPPCHCCQGERKVLERLQDEDGPTPYAVWVVCRWCEGKG